MALLSALLVLPQSSEAFVSPASLVSAATTNMVQSGNAVDAVHLNPTAIPGGGSATGKVVLREVNSGPLPLVVTLTKSNSSVAVTIPTTVTIPVGWISQNFPITAGSTNFDEDVQITASAFGTSATSILTVQALAVSQVTVSPSLVKAGQEATGTVTLNSDAPTGGAIVQLQRNLTAASVPASVTIPAGQRSANFNITTSLVVTNVTPVTIFARIAGGRTRVGTLIVEPPLVQSLVMTTPQVTGGEAVTGRVTLDSPAGTGGLTVSLTSNRAAVPVPATVLVPEGGTFVDFTTTTNPVSTFTQATLYAASPGSRNRWAVVTVNPPVISSNSINPTTVSGGTDALGTVVLNRPAPAGGLTVTLTSNRTSVVVPASITIPAGAASGTYGITTTSRNALVQATIVASFAGKSRWAVLNVNPPALYLHTWYDPLVVGGTGTFGRVIIDSPAPAGGITVALFNNRSAVTIPAFVTIPEGEIYVDYPINTTVVTTVVEATLYATYNGRTSWFVFTVIP